MKKKETFLTIKNSDGIYYSQVTYTLKENTIFYWIVTKYLYYFILSKKDRLRLKEEKLIENNFKKFKSVVKGELDIPFFGYSEILNEQDNK